MRKRDLAIIKDLERFRVMGRDDIVQIHFNHLKSPVSNANTVLKRLVRDGQIEVSTHHSPYVYFPPNTNMKKSSTKIPHYLRLVEIYRKLHPHITTFQVEPKFKKGLAEPDIFCKIKGTSFFIEVQRNVYSQKVMNEKIKRYEKLYYEVDHLPPVIMITDVQYEINSEIVRVFQFQTVDEFIKKLK